MLVDFVNTCASVVNFKANRFYLSNFFFIYVNSKRSHFGGQLDKTVRCELGCIFEKVDKNLLDTLVVGLNDIRYLWTHRVNEVNVFPKSHLHVHQPCNLVDQLPYLDAFEVYFELPSL